MEKNDEKNESEPTGESNNSQETDEGGDTKNNSDSSSDSSEQGNEFYENLSSESSSTVLVSEIKEEMQEGDHDELEREIEKELEKEVEVIDKYLEEEVEFIKAYQEIRGKEQLEQHQIEPTIQEALETDPESMSNENEIENLQELELEEQFQTVHLNDYVGELVEKQEEKIEQLKEQEEKEEQEAQASKIKEANSGLYEEVEVERDGLDQHEVEATIEEELETEPEPIINEKEVEKLQELDIEEQFQMVHFNEYMDELVEKQDEEAEKLKEQEEQVEKEELEAQASKIKEANFELYEEVEVERDGLDQHEVEATIEEELETEPEPIINEKEVEKLQELDIEEQFQMVHFNEYIDELVERQEEDKNIENDKIKQEKENIEHPQDVIHQSTYLQEKLEEQEQELELDYEEKDIVEQHQVESAIEEELKTEPKPIVNEEELEYIKNLEPEKQLEAELFYEFIEEVANKQNEEKEEREENEEKEEISTEQKIAQIMRELDIPQKINADETEVEKNSQEGELEQEPTFPDEGVVEQLEIEENIDHQQELEEILEQNRKIEQEALIEIEKEEEDSDKTIEKNYERVKRLYKQQTGKRPIYANKETKGFKQWLEQKKKSEEKEKPKQKQEIKEEQKKEEGWKTTLKRWIKEASEEECNAELKSELKRALESYNEFEDLTQKFLELYKKSQHEKLTEIEKNRLKSLTERLQGLGPIQLELLENIRAFKFYFNNNLWELMNKFFANRVRSKFFKHISQIYKNLKQAQKKKENSEETLKNWIEQASEEEISPELKSLLKEIVENYSKLDEVAIAFMKLYDKAQHEKLSKTEKRKLKFLIETLQKIEPSKIELFTKIRAITRYFNDKKSDDFSNKTRVNQLLSRFFANFSQKYKNLTYNNLSGFFNKRIIDKINYSAPLSSKQIREREQDYQKKLEALCVKYALDFKNILIEEYGVIILELGRLPLSQHFGFRLDNYVRRVTEEKITQAVSVKILGRVKEHIMQQYNTFKKGVVKARSFKKVIDFIKGYQEFSSYFEREFSMSNIKYQQDSEELAPKSWLIENLRYMFPKRFGLPLKDDLLSWFVYGDIPGYGKTSKVKWTTNIEGISRRIPFADLLAIDYRVNKLTKKAFSDKGIEVSTEGLEILKKSVSFLIYYYVFGGYHEPTYVSEITSKGLKVGRGYFTIEYKVIRAIFFAAAEANNGESMYFEGINGINSASGISTDLKNHLYQGFGFGDDLIKLVKYINTIFKSRPPDSSCKIFHDAKEVLEGYLDDYKARHRILQESQEYASIFQGRVHKSMEDFFGLKFVSEEQVRAVVKETYVTTINDNGVKEKIYVHGVFKFDLYLELTNALKDYLGLDDKWMGLAIEALGTYWHSLPKQKEADRKKRLICRERNIILLEIPEAMDRSEWCTEALKQFKELTGVEIPRNKLSELYKYLGNA